MGTRDSRVRGRKRKTFRLSTEPLEPRRVLAPIINEFMASNDGAFLDGDGEDSDWIEIYNPTDSTIDLTGWHLTDKADNLDKWTFQPHESSILSPGEYLIVFASGQTVETYIDPAGFAHTDFKLSASGEYLALTDPDENIIDEFAPAYPEQFTDVSYGLVTNTATSTLVGPSNQTSALVPTDGSLDLIGGQPPWTLPGFDDSSWDTSANGVGVGFDKASDNPPGPANGTLLPGGLIGFDLTDSNEDGILDVLFDAGGADSSPGSEQPSEALDSRTNTKWLSFDPSGTWYEMQFIGGVRKAVDAYTITSANDAPDRDPYTWTLFGSNDGTNYEPVDTRSAQNFSSRFQTRLYEFTNNVAYEYYRFEFLTEFGVNGSNQPNSIQMAEIELLSSGELNYNQFIDVDVETDWDANQSSVYQRVEFNVDDPADFDSMLLEMQYDDGFKAYLNGEVVASRNDPIIATWQSNATAGRDDEDAVVPETINISNHLGKLVAGENVLAIHVLNQSDTSSDLLSRPRLTVSEQLSTSDVPAYMPQSTPGAPNVSTGTTFGPEINNVNDTGQPTSNQNITVTADVASTVSSVNSVELRYRVMFGAEQTLTMRDDGQGGDAVAGDGTYTAVIPSSAYQPGQMVRWYVFTDDVDGATSRMPQFFNPEGSAEYFGTVVSDPSVSSELPIFEYFVQSTGAASSRTGTRASVFFRGEFYDNVFIRRRGGNTTQGRKFEFNANQHFLFDPQYGRVDEINLNERGAEPTYMRQVLAWNVYEQAGLPASIGEAWHTRRNDSFLDVRIFVEQPDSDLLGRTGLDRDGAFYKIGDRGVENSVTSSTNGVKKRTRKNEDNADLETLVRGVRTSNPDRAEYVWDNIDIAAVVNYLAATSIMHDNDHPHKNFHLYRDTEGSQQWMFLPWDKDLTFGLNFGLGGIIGDTDPYGHPFFGDTDHRKVDNRWNRMIDAVLEQPRAKEMLVRRLRTLMDQFFEESGSNSWLHQRVAELRDSMQDELGGNSWLNEINRISNDYLTRRRRHLYVNHRAGNNYPDNAGIPTAQVGNPTILISDYEASPASGNQEEEYIEFTNPNNFAVDISNWQVTGGIEHTFTPGTVIPAGESLYISPDVPTFLARTSGPRGGMELFVQGNYSMNIGAGETVQLVAADGELMGQFDVPGGGDFNQDGAYNCNDIDALVVEIAAGTNNSDFDMNGDNLVNLDDRDEWLAEAGAENLVSGNAYLLGDANLDGVVDVSDFNIWNGNKFTSTAAWCDGDFNADGVVDVSDFNIWNGNKFTSSDAAGFVPFSPTRTALVSSESIVLNVQPELTHDADVV
ncbi:MAG: lamin tail domain-containing protein, partial [Planctomycetota bacterium]